MVQAVGTPFDTNLSVHLQQIVSEIVARMKGTTISAAEVSRDLAELAVNFSPDDLAAETRPVAGRFRGPADRISL